MRPAILVIETLTGQHINCAEIKFPRMDRIAANTKAELYTDSIEADTATELQRAGHNSFGNICQSYAVTPTL